MKRNVTGRKERERDLGRDRILSSSQRVVVVVCGQTRLRNYASCAQEWETEREKEKL